MSDHPITTASFAIIDHEIGTHRWTEAEYAIVRRAIHSTADFELKDQFVFSAGAIAAGIAALHAQVPLVVDVQMVSAGITPALERHVAIAVAPAQVPAETTRTATGLRTLMQHYPNAIVVIGNAPTALLALVDLVKAGRAKPALVIGVPVGFVAVTEAKAALQTLDTPYITIAGRKGGSAIAAAIVNALWQLAAVTPIPTPAAAPKTIQETIHVVGMGLGGWESLPLTSQRLLQSAALIAGTASQLAQLPPLRTDRYVLEGSVNDWLKDLATLKPRPLAILTSGDPLLYGLGRLLQQQFRDLSFQPAVSSVQLACARLGLLFQDVTLVSVHGREPDALITALKTHPIAIMILTDRTYSASAITQLVTDLRLPVAYTVWVCSRLGAQDERVQRWHSGDDDTFAEPQIIVLQREAIPLPATLPRLGLADRDLLTFADRPGLITKQPLRVLTLGLLQLPSQGVFWDIGAGTGSVAIEMARLVPEAQVYAIEKTAIGVSLIRANRDRFAVTNLEVIEGKAPSILGTLPKPERVLVGGGGADLAAILAYCTEVPLVVINCATLEACLSAKTALSSSHQVQITQANINQSSDIGGASRFVPLNPVWLVQAARR